LILIFAKMLENSSTKFLLGSVHEFVLHRGHPLRRVPLKLHNSNRDPEIRIGVKHSKIILTTSLTKFWVISIEFRKIHGGRLAMCGGRIPLLAVQQTTEGSRRA
jgi:hypothetical protein